MVSSVLMAELAALALAAKVAEVLQMLAVTSHTDSRDAVPQLQKGEEASFWRLRPLLSQFMCLQNSCDFKVIKISRHENRFAMQAKAVNNHNSAIFSCNSQEHQSACAAITVGDRRSSNVTMPPASSP
jgi:hypothetical protein